ncbi:hypothetical protein OS493_003773 [Desmophyllum pertusum]|uniref:Uncharacterized protein n=1 Tax=Desmophyllum pertusum TaxID=174260 RepID=A0A9X0A676_9CNID|nr:hypothetical protein OS493_003773 [Desmophyllum pertusum]
MEKSWISETSSEMFNYLYHHVTGEEEETVATASSSLSALSQGVWITDLPTNDYEPLENSPVAKKFKRERVLEEKIAALEAECNDKEKQIKKAKKKYFLAKGNFLKKKAEVEQLNNELQSVKEREAKLQAINGSLQAENFEILQERQDKIDNTSADIDQGYFSQRTYDLLNQLAASDAEVDAINCSLQQKLQQLQDWLDKLDNTSESCFFSADLSIAEPAGCKRRRTENRGWRQQADERWN